MSRIAGARAAVDAALGVPSGSQLGSDGLLLSLLPLFDFDGAKRVSWSDWRRGLIGMGLDAMADDVRKWRELATMYGAGLPCCFVDGESIGDFKQLAAAADDGSLRRRLGDAGALDP